MYEDEELYALRHDEAPRSVPASQTIRAEQAPGLVPPVLRRSEWAELPKQRRAREGAHLPQPRPTHRRGSSTCDRLPPGPSVRRLRREGHHRSSVRPPSRQVDRRLSDDLYRGQFAAHRGRDREMRRCAAPTATTRRPRGSVAIGSSRQRCRSGSRAQRRSAVRSKWSLAPARPSRVASATSPSPSPSFHTARASVGRASTSAVLAEATITANGGRRTAWVRCHGSAATGKSETESLSSASGTSCSRAPVLTAAKQI